MKKIGNVYDLVCLVLKKTKTHKVISSAIVPEDYFVSHAYGSKKIGDACHYQCLFITTGSNYGHLQDDDYRPTISKILQKGIKKIRILVASGIVCDDCGRFESDYRGFDEPADYVKVFDAISNRQELASFIRHARKNSITYRKGLCEQCEFHRERKRKEKEREELYQNWIKAEKQRQEEISSKIDDYYARKKIKIKKTCKPSELKQAEQFFQMTQAISEIANINTEKK